MRSLGGTKSDEPWCRLRVSGGGQRAHERAEKEVLRRGRFHFLNFSFLPAIVSTVNARAVLIGAELPACFRR